MLISSLVLRSHELFAKKVRPAEGHKSRHWSCFSEEDSIGVLKHVARHVSGAQSEQYLCKIARLRPCEWSNCVQFMCICLWVCMKTYFGVYIRICRYQLLARLKVAKKRMRRTYNLLQKWQLQTDVEYWDYFCKIVLRFYRFLLQDWHGRSLESLRSGACSERVPEKWSESGWLVKVVPDRMVLVKLVSRVRRDIYIYIHPRSRTTIVLIAFTEPPLFYSGLYTPNQVFDFQGIIYTYRHPPMIYIYIDKNGTTTYYNIYPLHRTWKWIFGILFSTTKWFCRFHVVHGTVMTCLSLSGPGHGNSHLFYKEVKWVTTRSSVAFPPNTAKWDLVNGVTSFFHEFQRWNHERPFLIPPQCRHV